MYLTMVEFATQISNVSGRISNCRKNAQAKTLVECRTPKKSFPNSDRRPLNNRIVLSCQGVCACLLPKDCHNGAWKHHARTYRATEKEPYDAGRYPYFQNLTYAQADSPYIVHACARLCVRVRQCACVCLYELYDVYVCACACVCTRMSVYMWACVCMCMCMCGHA